MSNDQKRGRRPPAAVHEVHLKIVEDLIMAFTPWRLIVETCMEQFEVEEITVRKWAQDVRARQAARGAEEAPYQRAIFQAKLEAAQFRFAGDSRATVDLLKLEAAFHGHNQPVKIQVSDGAPVASLTPEQRRAEIADLIKRRDIAEAAQAVKH